MTDSLHDNTVQLAALLQGRRDWRLEAPGDGNPWFFGVDGEARLAITPEMDGFLVYRADEDRSWVIPRIEQVEAWLDENEANHAGLSPTGEQWKRFAQEAGGTDDEDPTEDENPEA